MSWSDRNTASRGPIATLPECEVASRGWVVRRAIVLQTESAGTARSSVCPRGQQSEAHSIRESARSPLVHCHCHGNEPAHDLPASSMSRLPTTFHAFVARTCALDEMTRGMWTRCLSLLRPSLVAAMTKHSERVCGSAACSRNNDVGTAVSQCVRQLPTWAFTRPAVSLSFVVPTHDVKCGK